LFGDLAGRYKCFVMLAQCAAEDWHFAIALHVAEALLSIQQA
jgi:hypothetical protein